MRIRSSQKNTDLFFYALEDGRRGEMMNKIKTVFVYKEGSEDNVEGENITIVFPDRQSAFEEVRDLLAEKHPGENITDRSSDVYISKDEVEDGESWWYFYEDPVVKLPKNQYETIDIGKYQIAFNGVSYEKGYPYALVQIFEFNSAKGNAKPLHGGKAILSFYSELGGPELVRGADEKFVELLLANVKENSKANLYYWYKTWMYL